MTDQTKLNAEIPEYRAALEQAASDILKMVMEAMADPEGGIGIDQVIALIDGHIGPTLRAETPKPETQTIPLIAVRILIEGKSGAALNAVVEDYPELAEMVLGRKPEMQAGAMEARELEAFRNGHLEASTAFTNAIRAISPDEKNQWHQTWPPEEFVKAAFERYAAARDARRDAEIRAEYQQKILDLRRISIGECWYWQGDEDDHLESLSCPIIIRAEQVRDIQADAQKVGETVALREAIRQFPQSTVKDVIGSAYARAHQEGVLACKNCCKKLIPSDGLSLVAKHDAEIRAEALREAAKNQRDKCKCYSEADSQSHCGQCYRCWIAQEIESLIPAQPSNAKPAGGK
jgi:hypothetical protein